MDKERELVFISHANPEDNSFTLWLASRLRAAGYLVWSDLTQLFGGRLPYSEPEDVAVLGDGEVVRLAGLEFTIDHAPGHTRGSVLIRTPGDEAPLCFSGDVLFAGSIGRTDLPGGDPAAMLASLRDRVLPLADETVVLPGHGPLTTIGRERAGNPFLIDVLRSAAPIRPTVAT